MPGRRAVHRLSPAGSGLQAAPGNYTSSLPCRQDGGAHRLEEDIQWIVVKCTTVKQWRGIDVNMSVNVMDLVHLYRQCLRQGWAPRRIVLSGVLAVFLCSQPRF